MADKKKPPKNDVILVYIGVRANKNKLVQCFYKVLLGGTHEGDRRAYTKLKNLGRPGGVYSYELDAEDESSIYPATQKYIRFWGSEEGSPEEAETVEWQALHDAANIADRARKRQKKETSRNLIQERLEPIRAAYHKSVGWERKALIAEVVAYITRGSL